MFIKTKCSEPGGATTSKNSGRGIKEFGDNRCSSKQVNELTEEIATENRIHRVKLSLSNQAFIQKFFVGGTLKCTLTSAYKIIEFSCK